MMLNPTNPKETIRQALTRANGGRDVGEVQTEHFLSEESGAVIFIAVFEREAFPVKNPTMAVGQLPPHPNGGEIFTMQVFGCN